MKAASLHAIVQAFGWRPLAYRRADAKLYMMYNIVNGLVEIPCSCEYC